jgi:hypothetical protein
MNKLLYRTTGRYYLGDSSQQAQYVFQLREDAPKELSRSFLVKLDDDSDFSGSALDVASELEGVFEKYWISTALPKVKELIEYLEKWYDKDEYDALIEKREKLTEQLKEVENHLATYDHEEMENWRPEGDETTEIAQAFEPEGV